MAILTCDRCGNQIAKVSKCTYCEKQCCMSCTKSSKRVSKKKALKLFICKTCWTSMGKRKRFKSA